MFILILLIGLAAIMSPFVPGRLKKFIGIILSGFTFILFGFFIARWNIIVNGTTIFESYRWFPALGLNLTFRLDGISYFFALLILAIGALVFLYSSAYMHDHRHVGRFYSWILLFMSAMLGVVLAGDLICLYLFWSLTSVTSFLLIGFHNDQSGSRRAAWQALIITEGGGLIMLAGFILLGQAAGSYSLEEILSGRFALRQHPHYPVILPLLLAGALTKSAQFPFHFWLPAAMKAPTPVSAYLHSASMVNAGIYLLARFLPVFDDSLPWKAGLVPIGLLTMFFGVSRSVMLRDMKEILAYTTISVLGLLVFLLGTGSSEALEAALFYLLVHAFYKSGLFLTAGIIDKKTGTRDIYAISRLWNNMKVTAVITILLLLSMAGMPPLLGYMGKEKIYHAVLQAGEAGWPALSILVLSNALMFLVSAIFAEKLFFSGNRNPAGPIRRPGLCLACRIGPAVGCRHLPALLFRPS